MKKQGLTGLRFEEIIDFSVFVFAFLIPISSFLSTRVLLLTFIVSIFLLGDYRRLRNTSWDIFLYSLIIIFGVFYSDDLAMSLKILETNFSLLAIPVVVVRMKNLNEKKIIKIFYFFVAGLLLASCISLVRAFFSYEETKDVRFFFFYQFTNVINSHPTYFAYYLIFAIAFGLYILYYNKSDLSPYLIISILIFLFVVLVLTGGRTAFISILLTFSFFILRFLVGERGVHKKTTIVLVAALMIVMFLVNVVDLGNRYSALNDSWERFVLWESAVRATPSILWGAGTGDTKLLNDYYLSHNLAQYAEGSYNAHNQFIQILFSNGVFGLLAVLIMLARPLYVSVIQKNALGVLVFFPFLIYGMTEVFLGRYQGVAFFVLLHQCFIAQYQRDTPVFSLKSN